MMRLMAEPREHPPVLLVTTIFSAQPIAFDWARHKLQNRYGPILMDSVLFDFTETQYYDATMGLRLRLQLIAFADLIAPDSLADIKRTTNDLESEFAQLVEWDVARPLNIDPGYLSLAKWVLATTKDQAHRLYIGKSIFEEVTLRFLHGRWEPWDWTYPNYRREDYREFLARARIAYAERLRMEERRSIR